ncbi:MAG: hypothetical protein DMF11_00525 [Verrucomicrobia bacterium]|nr:MAG: hypothetical protein DMF11_00525 [Verrucomicrobiota bacterium]
MVIEKLLFLSYGRHLIVTRFVLPVPNCCLQLSFGSQLITRALRRGKSQLRRSQSALASAVADAGKCDRWKYGVAAHSRFAGQELDLICNSNFV